MRVTLMGVWHLYLLWRRTWVLRLPYGGLPVVVGVLEEDHVAILLARRAALPHYVPQRGRRLEETELRLEVLLTVRLGVYRPEAMSVKRASPTCVLCSQTTALEPGP